MAASRRFTVIQRVDGIEFTHKNTLYYAYYGGVYVKKDVAIDTNGKFIGYGYPGSGSGNANRTIQEGTLGLVQTFWKNPNYGALSLITQYSYLIAQSMESVATPV